MIDLTLLVESLPLLAKGALVTIEIALLGCIMGLSLGTVLGTLHASSLPLVRAIITCVTTVIRGTPMLIQILFGVFVLPQLGIYIPTFWAVILAIGFNSSAYISNIVRAGIASVGRGQLEAGKVLGLTKWQITRYIVLPQALRIALPALGNEFITLIKDSSLASVVGVMELSKRGQMEISRTYDALTIYTGVALVYLLITTTLSILISYAERRMNVHVRN